jgi:hypothetical protein
MGWPSYAQLKLYPSPLPKVRSPYQAKIDSISDKHVLAISQVFSALDERCLIERPVSIDALNDLVENVSIPFIKSILIMSDYWFLATQIDNVYQK